MGLNTMMTPFLPFVRQRSSLIYFKSNVDRPFLLVGMDRGSDYSELIHFLSGHPVPYIILMEATGKRIFEEIRQDYPDFQKMERLILTDHLEDAVKEAQKLTRPGHSCLMSPAAASYGIFKNFEERGEVFCPSGIKISRKT